MATPLGNAGTSAEYAPIEHLSLGAGLGTNLHGIQLAAMARVRPSPARHGAFFFGAGYSQGPHEQHRGSQDGVFSIFTAPLSSMGESNDQPRHWQTARWLNVELGLERRRDQGFDLRGFLGGAFLMNRGDNTLSPPRDEYDVPIEVRGAMLYLGMAIGYAI